MVLIWDIREGAAVNKIEPHSRDKVARSELGSWIGAVGINEDWLVFHRVAYFLFF